MMHQRRVPGGRYGFSGGTSRMAAANLAWDAGSTGLCLTFVLAGSLPRKLFPFQSFAGRIGLGTNPPPQFGQTLPRTRSTQAAQNVHSYEQMRASSESGGKGLLQFSQVGRNSSNAHSRRAWRPLEALPGSSHGATSGYIGMERLHTSG